MTSTIERAKIAVVEKLKLDGESRLDKTGQVVEPFIERHKKEIYEKLEHIYEEDAGCKIDDQGCGLMFITESLPLVNGIIHVGSSVADFKEAIKWAKTDFRDDADPGSILLALTFIYLAHKGADDHPGSRDWQKIRELADHKLEAAVEGGVAL